MGLFKSKEEKRREEKLLLNRALSSMKKQIERLEQSKQKYLDAAIKAKDEGSAKQYELAKYGIRLAQTQKTTVEQMLLNLEMTSQAKDASEAGAEFASGMGLLSGEIIKLSGSMNFDKVTAALSGAFSSSELNAEQLDETMALNADGLSAIGGGTDEVDRLIEQRLQEESLKEAQGNELDERIRQLRKNL